MLPGHVSGSAKEDTSPLCAAIDLDGPDRQETIDLTTTSPAADGPPLR